MNTLAHSHLIKSKSPELSIILHRPENISEDIIHRCKIGDRKAQRELYELTYTKLFNAALRYSKGETESKWVFNHAMFKVFSSLDKYKVGTNYLGWARTIIVKTSIDYLRKRIRENEFIVSIDATQSEEIDNQLNSGLSHLETSEIIEMIQKLPDRERIVFSMYEIDGYSHVEIEKNTGINKNTSKWLLASAKRHLREVLNRAYNIKNYGNE